MTDKVCSACGLDLEDALVKYYPIRTETALYYTCAPCLKRTRNVLQRMKHKSPEMVDLLRQIKKVLVVN